MLYRVQSLNVQDLLFHMWPVALKTALNYLLSHLNMCERFSRASHYVSEFQLYFETDGSV